ncbi:hypothetical protein GCM10017608_06790 [Agromyces luteolus]|uniref:Uncharacterized protein n=1 Tax=Agromyces luteolus TaxID=88373 RepID=A0A7C9HIZ7_9MICO|nr:hypothetical protein [Agromyces luteolus]MUN06224.1 hypothetical protein [Agromyces luteolus]GLK26747.1 hypothetical protein GCM10017608_06790 [Agromyces luteolus]
MDWTFWVAGVVIVGLVIVTQVFLHESRWSRRPREEEPPIDADASGDDAPEAAPSDPPSNGEADDDRSR